MRQIVDPSAGLGDRDQERLAAASFDRRVVRGHMDDALDGGGTGLVQGTAIVVTLAIGRPAELFAGSWACAGSMIWRSRSSRWFGVNVTRSRWRSRRSRSLLGNCSPALLALRWLRSAATTSASISAAGTRPTHPDGWGLFCSTAWET